MRRLAAVLIAITTTLATVPAVVSPAGAADSRDAPEPTRRRSPASTGTRSRAACTRPPAAGRRTLLWGHGWGPSYADSTGDGRFFAERGYNVVAMASTSTPR